jgi:hypothetical protein
VPAEGEPGPTHPVVIAENSPGLEPAAIGVDPNAMGTAAAVNSARAIIAGRRNPPTCL